MWCVSFVNSFECLKMNDEDVLLLFLICRRKRRRRLSTALARQTKRNFWVRPIFAKREQLGEFHTLVQEMRHGDREKFFKYLRMSPERYFHLLDMVEPYIKKKDTIMRKSISADERLTITLRYLASGMMQDCLSFSFRIGKSTVCVIIYEVCQAIWNALKDTYIKCPDSQEEWKNIANEFEEEWNFPHCVGAIDGKHIAMDCPPKSGSTYYCYKGYFSTVLLAVCDANYTFTLLDIGNYGSNNDAGILSNSKMGKKFQKGSFKLPPPEKLLGCSLSETPFFLVGDDIFPLSDWLLKPYSGKGLDQKKDVFNYRLSRARRVIENAFGILSARWRVFHGPIKGCVETVESITQAACILHNYLRLTDNAFYTPAGFVDSETSTGEIRPGDWRSLIPKDSLDRPPNLRGRRAKESALKIRDSLKDYVNSDAGSVSWQIRHVTDLGPMAKD